MLQNLRLQLDLTWFFGGVVLVIGVALTKWAFGVNLVLGSIFAVILAFALYVFLQVIKQIRREMEEMQKRIKKWNIENLEH